MDIIAALVVRVRVRTCVFLMKKSTQTHTHKKSSYTSNHIKSSPHLCGRGDKKRHSAEIRASKIDNSTAFRAQPGIGPIHRVSEIDGYRVHINSIPEPPSSKSERERGRHHPMERNLISIQSSARSPVSKGLLPCSRAWNSSFETKPLSWSCLSRWWSWDRGGELKCG